MNMDVLVECSQGPLLDYPPHQDHSVNNVD